MTARIFTVLTVLLAAAALGAFEPRPEHFATQAEWNLFTSWRENGGMYTVTPASMTSRSIEMQWKTRYLRTAGIRFELEDGVIARMGERLPVDVGDELAHTLAAAERVWFALQARRPEAAAPLLNAGLRLDWSGLSGVAAVDSLLRRFPSDRLLLLRANARPGDNELELTLTLPGGAPLIMRVPADPAALERLRNAAPREVEAPAIEPAHEEPSIPQFSTPYETPPRTPDREPSSGAAPAPPHRPAGDIDRLIRDSADLGEFVDNTWDRSLSRQLLQNKVNDVEDFLNEQLPNHQIGNADNSLFYYHHPRGPGKLGADITVCQQRLRDGVNIVPCDYYTLENGHLILPGGDTIDLTALSADEANLLAPAFVQLTYLHRALGTQLLDFLLLPDIVATTLVVKGEERRLYEPRNYFQSLLILSRWWSERTVYFSIRDVKIVNSHVEFRGYMVAQADDGRADYAEIRFHLNNDYRLDLAMMFLYPDIDLQTLDTTMKD